MLYMPHRSSIEEPAEKIGKSIYEKEFSQSYIFL